MLLDEQLSGLSVEEKMGHDPPISAPDAGVAFPSRPPSPALSRIYRCTPIPTIVLDATMSIVEVSDSHVALFGRSRDSLLHAPIGDIEPVAIPAPNIPTLYGALRAACSTKGIQVIETLLARGDVPQSLRVTPIFDGSTLLYFVLEAQRTIEETANYQHAYMNETYKIIVDTVKDYAIFMLDPQGRIATWSAGAGVLKGYKAEEIIGKHFSVLYSKEDQGNDKPTKALAVCLREGRFRNEGWRYRRDGSRFWADVLITPIYQFGQHVGFVKVTRDLTERKEAEARMISAFEESSRLKTNFLTNISHEIRTPMNGMQVAMTMLVDSGLGPQQREHARIVQESMSLLLHTVNDVLEYSKISSGSFSLHSDTLDIHEVVGAVVRNCRSSLKEGVEINITIAPDIPKRLQGDPLRFRQVLQNMVDNAVKFTEKGYVRVTTSIFPDEQDPACCTVKTEVADTGIGIPDSAINTLFTPFTRFANSALRKYPGTGLGLSICKSLAELMEGMVGYGPNTDGRGSLFWFTAKMGSGRPVTSSAKSRSNSLTQMNDTIGKEVRKLASQKHVLLVEDNLVNHTVMLKLLHSLGFERVDGAWNGAEAVRLIKQKPLSFDLILMDVSMPAMDGLAATQHIREMGVEMPIIAVTGNALQGDAETYMAKGMNDCIGKPVHRDQLLSVLWKWLGT